MSGSSSFKHEGVVREWLAALSVGGSRAKAEQLVSPHCTCDFFGAPKPISTKEFYDLMYNVIFPSFPDCTVKPVDGTYFEADGHIAVIVGQASGSHTGVPFAPFGFPALPTTNKKVANAQETMLIFFDQHGKIRNCTVGPSSDGLPGGPIGFYVRAGGKIPGQ